MAMPRHDTQAAVRFLDSMFGEGRVHLVAIGANGRVEAATFQTARDSSLKRWVEARQGVANLYFHVNELLPSVQNQKAKKEDVLAALFLHVDVDDPNALERIHAYHPRPTAAVFSGGGFQLFWRLKEATQDLVSVELCNAKIAQDLGGDNCHNIDRIMRLPGTINIPNAKKRARGRTEALAYEVADLSSSQKRYLLSDFEALTAESAVDVDTGLIPAHVDLGRLPPSVSAETRQLIIHGDDPNQPMGAPGAKYPSRSEVVFRVVCDLLRAGTEAEIIASILLDQAYGISKSIREKKQPERYAFRQINAAKQAIAQGWPDATMHGPKPTYRNAVLAIVRLDIRGQHDVFHHRKTLTGPGIEDHHAELGDDLCALVRSKIIERFGFDPGKMNVIEAANFVCLDNQIHPIREYLNRLQWDGRERLAGLLNKYFGAGDTPLHSAISTAVLIAAVRRVRQPGAKFDNVLVLEGKQGSGKSTAIRVLAGDENFADQDILSVDAKQQIELIEGAWLFELGELSGMNKADIARLKAFVTRQVDRGRPAYGRYREDRPRQVVFIGTTNQTNYLRDTTGNRRFWPVATGIINLPALEADRDQLWAEAAYLESQGASITLPEGLWTQAAAAQEARLEDHPWNDILVNARGDVANGVERITSEEIFSDFLQIPAGSRRPHELTQVSHIMQSLGWQGPKSMRIHGKVLRGYERTTEAPDHQRAARPTF